MQRKKVFAKASLFIYNNIEMLYFLISNPAGKDPLRLIGKAKMY